MIHDQDYLVSRYKNVRRYLHMYICFSYFLLLVTLSILKNFIRNCGRYHKASYNYQSKLRSFNATNVSQ